MRYFFGAWGGRKVTSSSQRHLRVEPRPAPPRRGPPARFSMEEAGHEEGEGDEEGEEGRKEGRRREGRRRKRREGGGELINAHGSLLYA